MDRIRRDGDEEDGVSFTSIGVSVEEDELIGVVGPVLAEEEGGDAGEKQCGKFYGELRFEEIDEIFHT